MGHRPRPRCLLSCMLSEPRGSPAAGCARGAGRVERIRLAADGEAPQPVTRSRLPSAGLTQATALWPDRSKASDGTMRLADGPALVVTAVPLAPTCKARTRLLSSGSSAVSRLVRLSPKKHVVDVEARGLHPSPGAVD